MNKRILWIISSLKYWWGAEKISTYLTSELIKKWYDITFFTFYKEHDVYHHLGKEFCLYEAKHSHFIFKIFKFFSRAYHIAQYCRKNNIWICISFMEEANFSAILSKIFWNSSKLVASIRHSLIDYKWAVYPTIIRLLYPYATRIVVLTSYEKRSLVTQYHVQDTKIIIIPNPITLNNEVFEKIITGSSSDFTYITIWRLNPVKNQAFLIQAFLRLEKEYSNVRLWILGEWSLRWYLAWIIQSSNNIFLLWNQKCVWKYLSQADCFVLSSISEAFPNVILEAMQYGLPVISSSTQGSLEILWEKNRYGIIYEQGNITALYEAMEKIYLKRDIVSHYIKKSKTRVKDFEPKNIIFKWEQLIWSIER